MFPEIVMVLRHEKYQPFADPGCFETLYFFLLISARVDDYFQHAI
jgi:hypothetical protein